MTSRPGSAVIVQVAGTVAVAVVVVGVFANLRSEPTAPTAGEATQVRGIAAADLRRDDVVIPTPIQKPAATEPAREARKPAPPPRRAPEAAKPQEPARTQTVAVAPVDPGPPLPLAPAQKAEEDSFVTAAGKTSVAMVRSSTEFVTSTVPKAVVSTTREAIDKARSFGSAVLDKVIP